MNSSPASNPAKVPPQSAIPSGPTAELDLTQQDLPADEGGASGPSLKDYNPEQDREQMRGTIARLLLWLLIVVIVLSFVVVSWCDDKRWVYLKEFLTIVFGPLTTLIGAVTGFYYGSVQKQTGKA